jgi:hypothetical protein
MGYQPSRADPDFWIKDCETHYEYLATYVDDVLSFSKDPMAVISELKKDYVLKGIGQPRYYLGGDVLELDGSWHKQEIYTALAAKTYIEQVVEKYEKNIGTLLFEGQPWNFKEYKSPMEVSYHPESEQTEPLDSIQASLYRGMIGSANWMITLGRFDINYAVNSLSRFGMAPRKGHLNAMFRIFGYLKKFPQGQVLIDPNRYDVPHGQIMEQDWTEFYPDMEEELPPNMPLPKGRIASTTCYVDSDHAHDVVTRRSVSGILLFMNSMPVKWFSKRQKTVETSSYGSELVAARNAVDLIIELRYKLRMLGVPIAGPTLMLGDNMSVVINTTMPSSQLKKKHNAIAYHRVRESIASKIVLFAHIPSKENLADFLTKPLPNEDFQRLVHSVLFRNPFSTDVKDAAIDNPNDLPPESTTLLK